MSLRQEQIITATFFVLQFIVVASGKLTYGKLKVVSYLHLDSLLNHFFWSRQAFI
jgi:hypothetical protein